MVCAGFSGVAVQVLLAVNGSLWVLLAGLPGLPVAFFGLFGLVLVPAPAWPSVRWLVASQLVCSGWAFWVLVPPVPWRISRPGTACKYPLIQASAISVDTFARRFGSNQSLQIRLRNDHGGLFMVLELEVLQ